MRYKKKDELINEVISVRVPHHLKSAIKLFSCISKHNSVSDIVRIATNMINTRFLFDFKKSKKINEYNFYNNKTIRFRLNETKKKKVVNFSKYCSAGISELVRFALNRLFNMAKFKLTSNLIKNLYLSLNQQISYHHLHLMVYESCYTSNLLNFSALFYKIYRRYPRLLV